MSALTRSISALFEGPRFDPPEFAGIVWRREGLARVVRIGSRSGRGTAVEVFVACEVLPNERGTDNVGRYAQ